MVPVQPQFLRKLLILATATFVAVLVFPLDAWAATSGPQSCTVGSNCVVGEFLYDDEYVPIITATCTLTSHYPDGTAHLTDQAMTGASDGWYAYTFTAPSTTGVYRAEVCCTAGSDYLCLDKSFEISAASSSPSSGDIASAVWGYSSRTLSSFGSLVTNVWNNTIRTITGTTTETADLSEIEEKIDTNRLLLEQLVNEPIIETFLEEEEPDLGAKIEDTKKIASRLTANYQFVKAKANLIVSKWSYWSETDLLDSVMDLSSFIGEESDALSNETIFGQLNWMKNAWGWKVAEDAYNQTKGVKNSLASVQSRLASYDKSQLASQEMRDLVAELGYLEQLVGDSADSAQQKTFFGQLKQVQDLAALLESHLAAADKILFSWVSKKDRGAQDLARKILAVNKVPRISFVLTSNPNTEKDKKNQVLAMRGVVKANQLLLARPAGKALSNTWLEVGSIVFKSLITNPSNLISQTVPLKYYLPPEVREEDIIETSDGLRVEYDTEKDQYYVAGEFTLSAGETQTVSVKVNDIWVITTEEIDSLRRQAEELARPLERTSFFAQGVTLKSDIDVSLDKVLALEGEGVTPEAKIRAHREAMIELNAAREKLEKMQELVAQAGSAGTFFGFVGGAQTLAVWGLIIIMVTGFVFLVIYMKKLGPAKKAKAKSIKPAKPEPKPEPVKEMLSAESKELEKKPVKVEKKRPTQSAGILSFVVVTAFSTIAGAVLSLVLLVSIQAGPSTTELISPVPRVEETPKLEGEAHLLNAF